MTRDYQSRGFVGGAPITSTLSGNIGTGDTTFSFNAGGGTGFPTANFWVLIDPLNGSIEKMLVGARSGDNCTGVVRGVDNTTAKTHTSGASIIHTGAAQDFVEANALAAALTTKGDSLWKGGTLSVAPARLAAGTDQQIVRYLAANSLGVETTHLGSIPKFATTAARDAAIAAPSAGQADYEDTGDTLEGLWFYNGTSWRRPWNMPWGYITSATRTTTQSAVGTLADITSMSVTFTAVGNRRYKLAAIASITNASATNTQAEVDITDSSNVRQAYGSAVLALTGVVTIWTVTPWTILSPSAGSVTYKLRASATGGATVDILGSATGPMVLTVEDIGPSGAPT